MIRRSRMLRRAVQNNPLCVVGAGAELTIIQNYVWFVLSHLRQHKDCVRCMITCEVENSE